MINVDMWYGNKVEEIQKLDIFFYPNEGQYRGNFYKDGKAIGDFTTDDSVELEMYFLGLKEA